MPLIFALQQAIEGALWLIVPAAPHAALASALAFAFRRRLSVLLGIFWEAFLSVWCFFAAAASAAILGHFVSVRRANFAMAPA